MTWLARNTFRHVMLCAAVQRLKISLQESANLVMMVIAAVVTMLDSKLEARVLDTVQENGTFAHLVRVGS